MSDRAAPVTHLPPRKGNALRWAPFFFIFLQSVLYGFGDPISKAAYEVLPVYSLLTARYAIALVFLVPQILVVAGISFLLARRAANRAK